MKPVAAPPFGIFFLLLLPSPTLSQPTASSACPLDFSVIHPFLSPASLSADSRCNYLLQLLHLVLSHFLLTQSLFHPSLDAAPACWAAFQAALLPASLDVRATCGFRTPWISQGCMNLTSRDDFESRLPYSANLDMVTNCNRSLIPTPACTACTASLARITSNYLRGPNYGNVSDCTAYPSIYAAAAISRLGPGNVYCYFLLSATSTSRRRNSIWIYTVVAAVCILLLLALAAWICLRRRRSRRRTPTTTTRPSPALDSISASTTLVKFAFDEIKRATRNFSRENIIGHGGFGNVYKGVLRDGTYVALKRFKNCSAAGDASFAHEVEVIASVRHINLLALRGYCIATTQMEGHQRIIICDLMCNGSLYDHLFTTEDRRRLTWPLRQKIAVGTARGLAYLHNEVQPAIIHRDIKASNILLDENFEPKVADFGLAKYAPEGMSHLSTKVAGTLGYVSPEYALYGQLSEKSDVFGFGVLLLELLSGKKAFISLGEGQAFVLSDWAWSLVRTGRALDVIEEGMEELGPKEVLEKYVHVAVLSTHPQLHARPTMDQILKILETDLAAIPFIPDRPISILSNMEEIERSMSSSGSGHLFGHAGYQLNNTFGKDGEILNDSGILSQWSVASSNLDKP
ncbi:probable LRR receptor-like serine/threonine-protein kinase RKF3 [Zingiber officinale]|uniref:non-specific serine/threonine protein kinase n=1 Tax=Zingiber officinale TaxID=94328 RepID=A0A8J5C986_ZINOF|nr:probable LRR receptor-like serine/threonine-protein kinase RKF3 [Zingiber officinale]KAG6470172.1 hypothetical protein ZIOFF_071229 [Zingiber officinale]